MFTVCYAWDAAVSVVGHTVVTLLATWVLYRLAYRLLFSGHESVMDSNGRPRHVLVTGCDTGFGNGLAKKLHAKGYHVHAGCLFEMSAAQLNDEYKSTGRMHALRMDVTSDRDVEQALKKVTDALGDDELWAVVNNAGILTGAFIEWTSVRDFQRCMDVNHTGGIRVTTAFLPLIRKSHGHIVNVTSAAGFTGSVGLGAYCCSKFAFEAYSECLRLELRDWGVKVSIIEPGFFDTPIVQRSAENLEKVYRALPSEVRERWGDKWWAERRRRIEKVSGLAGNPKAVVDTMYNAVAARYPLPRYQVGWDCKIVYNLLYFLPSVVKDQIQHLLNRQGNRPAALSKKEE